MVGGQESAGVSPLRRNGNAYLRRTQHSKVRTSETFFAPPKMLRTRLLSFTVGFSVAGAAIAYFVWRDLLTDRHALSSQMKREFDDLETRISKLESLAYRKPEAGEG